MSSYVAQKEFAVEQRLLQLERYKENILEGNRQRMQTEGITEEELLRKEVLKTGNLPRRHALVQQFKGNLRFPQSVSIQHSFGNTIMN